MNEDIDFTAILEALKLNRRRWISKTNKEIEQLMKSIRMKNRIFIMVTPSLPIDLRLRRNEK